jgi:DNA repair exonuclease SbcCD ATPase subunit
MNARTEAELSVIETPFDNPVPARTVEMTAVVPVIEQKSRLEVTEILDAEAKDEKANTIGGIVPLKYTLTGAILKSMLDRYSGVQYDVATPEGRKMAKEAAADLKAAENKMEAEYKAWNSPIMAMTKHARTQKDKAAALLDAIRKPIVEALDAIKRAEEQAEAERAAKESARVAAHMKAIAELEALPGSFLTASVATIDAAIAEVSALDYLNFRAWNEYADQARGLQIAAVETLKAHRANAEAREALEAERAARAAEDAKRAADAAIGERITAITTAPMSVFNKPADEIKRLLNRLNLTDTSEFGERAAEAGAAVAQAKAMVEMMLTQAQAAESKQAELDRLQAEEAKRVADAQAAETAAARAKQAEIDRIEREAREAAEAEDRKHREADQARARELSARRLRMEDHADELLALLTAARAYVTNDGLIAQIDALTKHIEGA